MIATEVAYPLTPFKLSLVSAIFIAMPYILHQIWAFIAPGLYSNEKRIAFPLLTSASFCSMQVSRSPITWSFHWCLPFSQE